MICTTREFMAAYPLPTGYPLWIRSLWSEPTDMNEPGWAIWQYHCRARVPGIEVPVDLNVMRGPRPGLLAPSANSTTAAP